MTTSVAYFDSVFRNNAWQASQSRSGPGSQGVHADFKVGALITLVEALEASSILDIGCGDMHWMQRVLKALPGTVSYTGVDVSEAVIDDVSRRLPALRFSTLSRFDFARSDADVVILFDVVGHMLHEEIIDLFERMRRMPHVRYLVTIDHRGHVPGVLAQKSRFEGVDIFKCGYTRYFSRPSPIFQCIATVPGDWLSLYAVSLPNAKGGNDAVLPRETQ